MFSLARLKALLTSPPDPDHWRNWQYVEDALRWVDIMQTDAGRVQKRQDLYVNLVTGAHEWRDAMELSHYGPARPRLRVRP